MKTRIAILTLAAVLAAQGLAGPSAAAPPQPDYHPSMGDLMTMAVQPRHTKLAYGLQAKNWAYAAYETDELRHAFDRIARTIPTYRDTDVASAANAKMKEPLDALEAAVKARNAAAATLAYGKVTRACNACHQSLNHPEVVVRAPTPGAYPDQDFRPHATK